MPMPPRLLVYCRLLCFALGGAGCGAPNPAPVPLPPPAPVRARAPFADATRDSGIDFTYRNGEEAGHFAIIESLGGGVALFDLDNDGLLDIFFPGGGYYRENQVLGHPCRVYRNLGGFRFEDVSARAGLGTVSFPYSHGAAAFDFDRDGWTDIVVTGYNRLVLLRNEAAPDGSRRLADITRKAGLSDNLWSTSAGWGDLDGDGHPELYVAHYGDWGFGTNHPSDCTYDGKTRDVCQPRRFKPLPHTLYRNNGNGTFTDISEAQKLRKDGRGIGVVLLDADGDGRADIYAANDTDDNFLYLNKSSEGRIVLEECGLIAGVARDDRGMQNGSMGIAVGDFDQSGKPSILVTNYENELPALYQNRSSPGQPRFTFASLSAGIGAAAGSRQVSWGTGFLDFDLDGREDLLIVNGHAIRFPAKTDRRQKPRLLHNQKGTFKAVDSSGWAYLDEGRNARGAAFGDLDNDGKADAVVSHINEPVAILRNVAETGERHWLGLRLSGARGADITGARVEVETGTGRLTRFILGGGSYASTNDPRVLVGLGVETGPVRVAVVWPSGKRQELPPLEVDRYWDLLEGDRPVRARRP